MGGLRWLLAGALVSFGIVGYLTGLMLVPFGIALGIATSHSHGRAWPCLLLGLGLGPIVLLGADIKAADPPSGALAAFWLGMALLIVGVFLCAHAGWRTMRNARQ